MPLCPRPGCHEGRVRVMSPGVSPAQRDLCRAQRAPWPHSRAASLLVSRAAWGRRRKPCLGQIQPLVPAAPSLHSPACLHPCLSLCTHRSTPRDRLLLSKPQLCRPLFPPCSSRLPEKGCRGLINTPFSILAFPCLGLLCSGNSSIFQTAGNPLNKAFTGSQLCQAPCTLGRGL